MTKYAITSKFQGYRAKTDITNLPDGVLTVGSQNVLLNDGERVAIRKGFALDGQANVAMTPITAAYDWQTHLGHTRNLRAYQDELEYRYVDSLGAVTWRRLENGWGTAVNFNFAEVWDTTEEMDQLVFVNGSSNIYEWSGAVTTFASATAATLTKQGTTSWGEEGFYVAGTRRVILDGIVYTYTGGENTVTLTGVTPNPTLGGHVAGAVVHQQIRTFANAGGAGLPTNYTNDLIATLTNQIYVGSFTSRLVYVSKINSITNFAFSSPRLVGEGALLTLDSTPVGFIPQENYMYITAGSDQWYQTELQLNTADQAKEALMVRRLKTTGKTAAQSQALISKIKNYVFFVTQEITLDTLGKLELINTPQSVNLSDPIKLDFQFYDFTGGQAFYWRNYMLITVPSESVVLMFNLALGVWEAPQVLPVARFSIIDGELYGHSNQVPESYHLFTGYNDNGNPISAKARFSYQNFEDRANNKNFFQFYNEGYIASNTTLTCRLRYNYLGSQGFKTFLINGADQMAVKPVGADGSLGNQNLGIVSFAGRGATTDERLPPKYRIIKSFPKLDFYEMQVEYSSNDIDQQWELLAFGPAVQFSTSTNADITQ